MGIVVHDHIVLSSMLYMHDDVNTYTCKRIVLPMLYFQWAMSNPTVLSFLCYSFSGLLDLSLVPRDGARVL